MPMFKLTYDQRDQIIIDSLKECYEDFKNPCDPPRYSFDPKEEAKENAKMRKALKRVLDWFGEKVD